MSEHDKHQEHVLGLRLALGSILSPKRPPLHHSASGSSSPLHSYSHHHSLTHTPAPETPPLPPAPHPTPAHALHPVHTPSRLHSSTSESAHATRPPTPSPPSTPGVATPPLHPHDAHALPHPHPQIPPHAQLPPAVVAELNSGTEAEVRAKRARFIATLQSKSAWDAMVHGSWM